MALYGAYCITLYTAPQRQIFWVLPRSKSCGGAKPQKNASHSDFLSPHFANSISNL